MFAHHLNSSFAVLHNLVFFRCLSCCTSSCSRHLFCSAQLHVALLLLDRPSFPQQSPNHYDSYGSKSVDTHPKGLITINGTFLISTGLIFLQLLLPKISITSPSFRHTTNLPLHLLFQTRARLLFSSLLLLQQLRNLSRNGAPTASCTTSFTWKYPISSHFCFWARSFYQPLSIPRKAVASPATYSLTTNISTPSSTVSTEGSSVSIFSVSTQRLLPKAFRRQLDLYNL